MHVCLQTLHNGKDSDSTYSFVSYIIFPHVKLSQVMMFDIATFKKKLWM